MPRGVEVRGDAAARDTVAIVVLQRSRFRYRSLGSEDKGMLWWFIRFFVLVDCSHQS